MKIEFYTFKNLLNKVNEHSKVYIKQNCQDFSKQLKNTIENQIEYNNLTEIEKQNF